MLTPGYYIINFMSIAERDQSKGTLLYTCTMYMWSKGVAISYVLGCTNEQHYFDLSTGKYINISHTIKYHYV